MLLCESIARGPSACRAPSGGFFPATLPGAGWIVQIWDAAIFRTARLLLGFSVGLLLARPATGATSPATFTPSQVEAVFLYNFAQFVEWPSASFSRPDAPIIIGVLGEDPFGSLLDDVARGEKINGRPVLVRRFARVQEIEACHVLFISRSEENRLGQICSSLAKRHILTVSDIPNFARRGGIIELFEDHERIRFRIALQLARSESLVISAKLLRPAEVVSHFGQLLKAATTTPPSRVRAASDLIGDFFGPTVFEWVRLSLDRNLSLQSWLW